MKALLVATLLFGMNHAIAGVHSQYTSLSEESCVVIDSTDLNPDAEIDFLTAECPSLGGYQVYVAGGDLRYSAQLKFSGKDLPNVELMAFHSVADKMEWRYRRIGSAEDRKVEYTAAIYRLNYQDMDPDSNPIETSMMVVLRLKGAESCLLGTIPASKDMNEKARALADNMSAPCQP